MFKVLTRYLDESGTPRHNRMEYALPEVGLNVAYCLPDTWEPKARTSGGKHYRDTCFYQHLLRKCTADDGSSGFILCMHRKLFDIDKHRFNMDNSMRADKAQWVKDYSRNYDGAFHPRSLWGIPL